MATDAMDIVPPMTPPRTHRPWATSNGGVRADNGNGAPRPASDQLDGVDALDESDFMDTSMTGMPPGSPVLHPIPPTSPARLAPAAAEAMGTPPPASPRSAGGLRPRGRATQTEAGGAD